MTWPQVAHDAMGLAALVAIVALAVWGFWRG